MNTSTSSQTDPEAKVLIQNHELSSMDDNAGEVMAAQVSEFLVKCYSTPSQTKQLKGDETPRLRSG